MRVYYVSSGLQGCYFYRCLTPMMANGWDGDQTTILLDHQFKTPENKTKAARNSDVVVFHRPDNEGKLELARMLKKDGKKIVFDNDDTYEDDGGFKFNQYLDQKRLEKNLGKLQTVINQFVKEADLVTTTTEFLANEYRKLNPNVIVLPNMIDPFYFDEPERNDTTDVRIGVTGSIGVTSDFDVARSIMERFRGEPGFKWVLYSMPKGDNTKMIRELYHDEFKIMEEMEKWIEWHGFTDFEHYYDTLNGLKLDIMAIPRADHYFNRCKSNIKFLEASMFEIPCVAQGFSDGLSPYQVDKDDARHMIIANDQDEFEAAIRELAMDKDKRQRIGRAAKEYVLSKYDINNTAELWQNAYQTLFQQGN